MTETERYRRDVELVNLPPKLRIVLLDIAYERQTQDRLRDEGRFASTCADAGMTDAERFTILARELGEVARATAVDADRRPSIIDARKGLRGELLQVAAVAVAWAERL